MLLYLIPFLSYLTLNNIVTLKSGLKVTQGHSNCYHSKAWTRFLFTFHSNYGSILHHFRDKKRYWSKIVTFSYPFAFDSPVRGGGFPSEYCHPVLYGKARMVGLPDGKKIEDMFSSVDRILACGRRTDGQTSCDGIVGTMHTCRAVKTVHTR